MIKFAGTPGKFFYMAINRIHPVGRVQKRIFSMVETLNNTGTELQHIYDTVCSVVPAMADEDMYFLDKMLNIVTDGGTFENFMKTLIIFCVVGVFAQLCDCAGDYIASTENKKVYKYLCDLRRSRLQSFH